MDYYFIFSDMAGEDPGTSDREPEGPVAVQLRRKGKERRAFTLYREKLDLPNSAHLKLNFREAFVHTHYVSSLPEFEPTGLKHKPTKRTDIFNQVQHSGKTDCIAR